MQCLLVLASVLLSSQSALADRYEDLANQKLPPKAAELAVMRETNKRSEAKAAELVATSKTAKTKAAKRRPRRRTSGDKRRPRSEAKAAKRRPRRRTSGAKRRQRSDDRQRNRPVTVTPTPPGLKSEHLITEKIVTPAAQEAEGSPDCQTSRPVTRSPPSVKSEHLSPEKFVTTAAKVQVEREADVRATPSQITASIRRVMAANSKDENFPFGRFFQEKLNLLLGSLPENSVPMAISERETHSVFGVYSPGRANVLLPLEVALHTYNGARKGISKMDSTNAGVYTIESVESETDSMSGLKITTRTTLKERMLRVEYTKEREIIFTAHIQEFATKAEMSWQKISASPTTHSEGSVLSLHSAARELLAVSSKHANGSNKTKFNDKNFQGSLKNLVGTLMSAVNDWEAGSGFDSIEIIKYANTGVAKYGIYWPGLVDSHTGSKKSDRDGLLRLLDRVISRASAVPAQAEPWHFKSEVAYGELLLSIVGSEKNGQNPGKGFSITVFPSKVDMLMEKVANNDYAEATAFSKAMRSRIISAAADGGPDAGIDKFLQKELQTLAQSMGVEGDESKRPEEAEILLMGSQATGLATEDSDYDYGIYLPALVDAGSRSKKDDRFRVLKLLERVFRIGGENEVETERIFKSDYPILKLRYDYYPGKVQYPGKVNQQVNQYPGKVNQYSGKVQYPGNVTVQPVVSASSDAVTEEGRHFSFEADIQVFATREAKLMQQAITHSLQTFSSGVIHVNLVGGESSSDHHSNAITGDQHSNASTGDHHSNAKSGDHHSFTSRSSSDHHSTTSSGTSSVPVPFFVVAVETVAAQMGLKGRGDYRGAPDWHRHEWKATTLRIPSFRWVTLMLQFFVDRGYLETHMEPGNLEPGNLHGSPQWNLVLDWVKPGDRLRSPFWFDMADPDPREAAYFLARNFFEWLVRDYHFAQRRFLRDTTVAGPPRAVEAPDSRSGVEGKFTHSVKTVENLKLARPLLSVTGENNLQLRNPWSYVVKLDDAFEDSINIDLKYFHATVTKMLGESSVYEAVMATLAEMRVGEKSGAATFSQI